MGDRRAPEQTVTKHSSKGMPLGPDEVLFRRRGAPERYAEHDIYFAHERDLPDGGRGILPESDLLKAIHSYASKFYAAHGSSQPRPVADGNVDNRSMDETALLAFGILLEESGREVLGRRGDVVFTEAGATGAADDSGGAGDGEAEAPPRVVAGKQEVSNRVTPRKKRRRGDNTDDTKEGRGPNAG